MKTFKEIEAFVRKAMDKNLLINVRTDSEISVRNDEYVVYFYKYKDSKCYNISTSLYHNRGISINCEGISITERESALFDLLIEDINDYVKNYTQDILDNFFGEDNSTKTVDDLEFDDENHNQ